MVSDFTLHGVVYVRQHDRDIDLHNMFEYHSHVYEEQIGRFILTFKRSMGQWVPASEYSWLKFIHHDVSYCAVSDGFAPMISDEKCLEFITFFPINCRDTNDGFIFQETPTERDDILYTFYSEHFIRVGCAAVELIWT